jgi:hypothetical protein
LELWNLGTIKYFAMKNLIILSFALFALSSATAQNCLPEGITFETQVEIDNFQTSYPGCTEIEGNVTINGDDITNLNGLNVLTSVGGSLTIGEPWGWNANPALVNLTGLENLTSIGGDLTLELNSILANLTGLDNLSAIVGSLSINNNLLLTDITSLGALTSIGGGLVLGNQSWLGYPLGNPLLISLAGLEGITSLAGLTIIGNHALSDLTGLNNIQSISGSVVIGGNNTLSTLNGLGTLTHIGGNLQFGIAAQLGWIDNPLLDNLTGLEGLTEIGGDLNLAVIGNDLIMEDNYLITSLAGLDNLDSISGNLQIGPYPGTGGGDWSPGGNPSLVNFTGIANLTSIGGDLVICKNDSLTILAGLENVTSIGSDLTIYDNNTLISIASLENIGAGSIKDLEIFYNGLLTDCGIRSICDYLSAPNGTVEIHDNATGCNSQEEVEDTCLTDVPEQSVVSGQQSAVSVYPNPTHSTIEFRVSSIEFQWVSLKIYNAQGQEVAVVVDKKMTSGEHTVQWDASALPAGIYCYRLLTADRRPLTGKIVKY